MPGIGPDRAEFEYKPKEKQRYSTIFSDPDWIRTNDPQLRRLMLYPTELPDPAFILGCKYRRIFCA